jgi:hypothetical protein
MNIHHRIVMLKETKKGDRVRLGKLVYRRGDYVPSERKYILKNEWNGRIWKRLVRGNQLVDVNF